MVPLAQQQGLQAQDDVSNSGTEIAKKVSRKLVFSDDSSGLDDLLPQKPVESPIKKTKKVKPKVNSTKAVLIIFRHYQRKKLAIYIDNPRSLSVVSFTNIS